MKRNPLTRIFILSHTLALLMSSAPPLWGQATSVSQPVSSSGTEFRAPAKEVEGKLIGQEDVLIQEVVIADSGHRYRRLDVGVSGWLPSISRKLHKSILKWSRGQPVADPNRMRGTFFTSVASVLPT